MKDRLSDKSKEATVPNPARRRFLQTSVAGAGVLLAEPLLRNAAAAALVPLEMTNTGPDKVPRKPLGRTGAQVSILGIGGTTWELSIPQTRGRNWFMRRLTRA